MSATPHIPFEPSWKVKIWRLIEQGKGLLSIPAAQRDFIDSFTLYLGALTVSVEPKHGQIWMDSRQVLQLDHAAKLVWARTMQKELQAGADNNSAAFRCLFYTVGLEDSKGQKHGWRIYEDGRMLKGIA